MRILIVAVHLEPSPQAVPLANAFLQSYLAEIYPHIPVETARLNFFLGMESGACADEIVRLKPDAVCFSMYVWNRGVCLEIARQVRCLLPRVVLFAGGPETTADPGGLLAGDSLDFAVSGEGEAPFAEVCRRLAEHEDIAGIPGVAVRTETGVALTPSMPLTELDAIPSPWLNNTINAAQYPGILWQLSRGCSFNCDFCFDARGVAGVRRFSLERIEAELRHFAACNVSQVFVLDSTFNQDKARAKKILRLIRKIAPRIHFHFEVRSEFIDLEMAELFAGITCSLQIGLQSADPAVLKRVGRLFRRDDFINRITLLNETGAVFGFDLMYGLPGDSLAGFRASLNFAISLYPNSLDIFPLAILPGTALAARAVNDGLRHLPSPPYTLTSSPTFSAAEMQKAARLAAACSIFYTRGRAVAWFNGVLEPLKLQPSLFLEQFDKWLENKAGEPLEEATLSDDRIWQLQRDFLISAFAPKKLKRFLPAVLDLVDYHYHYAAALMSPPLQPVKKLPTGSDLLDGCFCPAHSARLAAFHYEILEILEAGATDVIGLSNALRQSGSWAIIYPAADEVFTESIDEAYFKLLQQLDGGTSAGTAAARLGIPADQARAFIEFAVTEGIVV